MSFRLKLLGGAAIESDAGPLTGAVAQRRRLALLALLAASPADGMSRERLATFLFPELDTARAHKGLADALHAIRKALDRDAVIAAGDELRLNAALVRSDVAEVRAALAGGDHERAVALYRGPFLDGFFVPEAAEFERWVELERSRLAGEHAEALETLAERAERTGAHAQAVGWWSRLVAHDPFSSRAVCRLAEALVVAGDPARALREARAHVRRLREELDIEASAAVPAVIDRLQATEIAPPVAIRPPRGGGHQAPAPPQPAAPAAPDAASTEQVSRASTPARGHGRAALAGAVLAVALLAAVSAAGVWGAGARVAAPAAATAVDPARPRALPARAAGVERALARGAGTRRGSLPRRHRA